jgi:ankyrin repeat protein
MTNTTTTIKHKNVWDTLPYDIKHRIFAYTDPLTKYLGGFLEVYKFRNLPEHSKEGYSAWITAFETNYKGNLRRLPPRCFPGVRDGLMLVKSREMYERLWQIRPDHDRCIPDGTLLLQNGYTFEYSNDLQGSMSVVLSLIHIPMRNLWVDIDILQRISTRFPIACAKIAAMYNHYDYLMYLLKEKGVDPSKFVESGRHGDIMPFTVVCEFGDVDAIKYMIERGCRVTQNEVYAAISSRSKENVQFLYEMAKSQFAYGSLLSVAVKTEDIEYVTWLNDEYKFGFNNLWVGMAEVVAKGCTDMVEYILNNNPFPVKCESYTVENAVFLGHIDIIGILLKKDAIPLASSTFDKIAGIGNLELVKRLHALQPNLFTNQSIVEATASGNLQLVKFLLENAPKAQYTLDALKKAVEKGHLHIMKYFLSISSSDSVTGTGTDPSTTDGKSPRTRSKLPVKVNHRELLTLAATHGRLEVVKYIHTRFQPRPSLRALEYAACHCQPNVLGAYRCTLEEKNLEPVNLCINYDSMKINDHFETFKYIYENSAFSKDDVQSFGFAMLAVRIGHLGMLQYVLENEIDVEDGCMGYAMQTGDTEYVKEVYDVIRGWKCGKGSDKPWDFDLLGKKREYLTTSRAIDGALDHGSFEFVDEMIKTYFHGDVDKDEDGDLVDTVLFHSACRNGRLDVIQAIHKRNPTLFTDHETVSTGFYKSERACQASVVAYLVSNFPEFCDADGALMNSTMESSLPVIDTLIPLVSRECRQQFWDRYKHGQWVTYFETNVEIAKYFSEFICE